MTMAAAGCKQGIILDRLWTALLLVSSKGPREASKLTKRPTDQIFDEKKVPSDFFGKTVFHLGTNSGAEWAISRCQPHKRHVAPEGLKEKS